MALLLLAASLGPRACGAKCPFSRRLGYPPHRASYHLMLPARLPAACQDLAKDTAPHFRKAKKFYETVATELVAHGHACDLFNCSLDQVKEGGGGAALCRWACRGRMLYEL